MNRTSTARVAGCIALAILCSRVPSFGSLFMNDAVIGDLPGAGPCFYLTQSMQDGGLFALYLTDQGAGACQFSYAGIAEEFAVFAATPGDSFTPSVVQTTTPLVSNNGVDPGAAVLHFTPFTDLYLAYWDDRNAFNHLPGASTPDESDHYGWARLHWDGTTLSVSNSVTASGGGVVIGSAIQAPEPGTLVLMLIGGLVVCARRNASRHAQTS